MRRYTFTSVGTRILALVLGSLVLTFSLIGLIGALAFRNLADNFFHIVEASNDDVSKIMNENAERTKNRIVELFEEAARTKGENLIARDSLNLHTAFLDNSYTQVRETLQNSFNFEATMLMAAFIVMEDHQIKAWQYIDRNHKGGLNLPIVYDNEKQSWTSPFKDHTISVADPGIDALRWIDRATIRKVQVYSALKGKTVAAYEAIVPIAENSSQSLQERIAEGEPVAFLRYLISLEVLEQTIALEEKDMNQLASEQRASSQKALEHTLLETNDQLVRMAIILLSTGLAVLALAFVISLWLSRKIALPVIELSHAANRIAKGEYSQGVAIDSHDEIGLLGQSFESMRVQVKKFTEKLQVLVDERTARLHDALETVTRQSQKIRDIMDQIDQGIITIDKDLKIEAEHSKHLESLYPDRGSKFSGESVIDVVFRGSTVEPDHLDRVRQTLALSLGADPIAWEFNSANLPQKIQYRDRSTLKTYELHWSPMIENDIVLRSLLTLRDKTKELALEQQVEEASQHSSRLTLALADLLKSRQDAVAAMLNDSLKTLVEIENLHRLGDYDHKRSYIGLHTMKGAARSLGLTNLSQYVHEAEVYIQHFFQFKSFDSHGFDDAIKKTRDELDFLRDVATRILKLRLDDASIQKLRLFDMLADEVREAERLCGVHKVELGAVGIEDRVIRWNARFLIDLVQACRHALTNSLDHGYFKPIQSGRLSAQEKVVFRISAYQEDDFVLIDIRDEGFGFDREAILTLAKDLGISLNSDEDYFQVLLLDGLSTAKEVTQLSGRGAGLSAIQTFAKEWQGELRMMHNSPRGSRLQIRIPLHLAVLSPLANSDEPNTQKPKTA